MTLPARLLAGLVRAYQRLLSPLWPPTCRYTPSCSAYMLGALQRHGALQGLWLGTRRILRCHPFGGLGHDPVPGRAGREEFPGEPPARGSGGS
ncbi:MAG: membrane protein insertion efficiency factor YidD [Planctomycetota bacterium]